MKLSEKGIKRFNRLYWEDDEQLHEIEFEPDDLEDCVMLTIKEAKEILQSSYDVLSWARVGPTHMNNALNVQELLKYRIEQAEAVK